LVYYLTISNIHLPRQFILHCTIGLKIRKGEKEDKRQDKMGKDKARFREI